MKKHSLILVLTTFVIGLFLFGSCSSNKNIVPSDISQNNDSAEELETQEESLSWTPEPDGMQNSLDWNSDISYLEKDILLPHEATSNRLTVKTVEQGVEITIDTRGLDNWRDGDGWLIERNSGIRVQFLKRDIVSIFYPFTVPGTAADFWVINTDDSVQIMPLNGIGNPLKKEFQNVKIYAAYDKDNNDFYGKLKTEAKSSDYFFNTTFMQDNNFAAIMEFYIRVVKGSSRAGAYASIYFKEPESLSSAWLDNPWIASYSYAFENLNEQAFKLLIYDDLNVNNYDSFYAELQLRIMDNKGTNFYLSGPESALKNF